MKKLIKVALKSVGLELRRYQPPWQPPAQGSARRPIGDVVMFLEDIRARGFQPRGIIDLGANRGDWTQMALSVFPESRVLMFEPQQEMRPTLDELCGNNPNLEFIQAGAGKEPGQLVQTIWEDLEGSSFLPEVSDKLIEKGTQRLTPIVTVDDMLKQRPDFVPDLVKLDIQGFELEALKGAGSIFGTTEVFILETSLYEFMAGQPAALDCLNFMHERGYEVYDVTAFGRRPYDGALSNLDFAFARTGGTLRNSNSWGAETMAESHSPLVEDAFDVNLI